MKNILKATVALVVPCLLIWLVYVNKHQRPAQPAAPAFYTVTIGEEPPAIWKMTNCIEAVLHTNNCYLIRWVDEGVTNEFHAWMVKVKIEKQEGKL